MIPFQNTGFGKTTRVRERFGLCNTYIQVGFANAARKIFAAAVQKIRHYQKSHLSFMKLPSG
jgi:hypothetical protein